VWTALRWQELAEHLHLVVGAAMCPACDAALSSPLAIMPSADLIPNQFRVLEVQAKRPLLRLVQEPSGSSVPAAHLFKIGDLESGQSNGVRHLAINENASPFRCPAEGTTGLHRLPQGKCNRG